MCEVLPSGHEIVVDFPKPGPPEYMFTPPSHTEGPVPPPFHPALLESCLSNLCSMFRPLVEKLRNRDKKSPAAGYTEMM